VSRAIVLAFALLLPASTRAAVTYSFDWYCSGCAKIEGCAPVSISLGTWRRG
jgi:hypothetical protein